MKSSALAAVRKFHWSFLAAPYPIPETLIGADYAGYLKLIFGQWISEKHGHKVMEVIDVYIDAFKNDSVIRSSCEDYRAGATIDIENERADLVSSYEEHLNSSVQKEGRYVEVPTLLLYSAANLGGEFDMKAVWENFVNNKLTAHSIGDGAGHFVNEEKPEECTEVLLDWLKATL